MALTQGKRAILQEIVAQEIISLKNEIGLIKDRKESIQTTAINPIAHSPGEEGPEAHDRDVAILQLRRFETRLAVLQIVERRLSAKLCTGKCTMCTSEIEWERLKLVPETEFCFSCASKRQ